MVDAGDGIVRTVAARGARAMLPRAGRHGLPRLARARPAEPLALDAAMRAQLARGMVLGCDPPQ
jgi:hypothetical protein